MSVRKIIAFMGKSYIPDYFKGCCFKDDRSSIWQQPCYFLHRCFCMKIVTLFAVAPAVRIKRRIADIEVLGIQPILYQPECFTEPLEVHDLALS